MKAPSQKRSATDPITKGRDAQPETVRVAVIKTTLYELIEALSDVVESGDETLVNAVVLDLIDSGRMRTSCSPDFSDHIQRTMTTTCGRIDVEVRGKGMRHA